MARSSWLALLLLVPGPARSQDALGQAEAVGQKGAAAVYDNASAGAAVKASAVEGQESSGCADETCGFRRGGPPPAALKKEPESPFTGDMNPDGTNKKNASKWTWKTALYVVVGAGAGAVAGFFIGGPIGAVVGGILGGLLGLLLNQLA